MKKSTIGHIAAYGVVALIGFGVGAAGSAEPTTAAAQPAVTKTVAGPAQTVEVEKPVTKTVTKEVTPDSCLDALDYADEGFTLSGESMQLAAEGFDAVFEMDLDRMEDITASIRAKTDEMNRMQPLYLAAKADCRASR